MLMIAGAQLTNGPNKQSDKARQEQEEMKLVSVYAANLQITL